MNPVARWTSSDSVLARMQPQLTRQIKDLVGEWRIVAWLERSLTEDHVKLMLPSV